MYQAIGNLLQVLINFQRPKGLTNAQQLVDMAIATTPGGLAFGCDMVLDIPLVTDLFLIQ